MWLNVLLSMIKIMRMNVNPRTDGGPGRLSTDGEGRIIAPRISKKRSKIETCGKRHWIRTDKFYIFLLGSFLVQIKNDTTAVKKVKMAAPENKGVFRQ